MKPVSVSLLHARDPGCWICYVSPDGRLCWFVSVYPLAEHTQNGTSVISHSMGDS